MAMRTMKQFVTSCFIFLQKLLHLSKKFCLVFIYLSPLKIEDISDSFVHVKSCWGNSLNVCYSLFCAVAA